ncbi:MAG: recombinase family protein [Dehalococcoidia bacterium]|nr:recombinase family protein [Dehalococcoidia bacterium]
MRAALYARVSSEEQVEGYSLDAQRRAFETLVEARGWTIYKEYIEEGKSARTENINKRPVFREAIADGLDRKYDILVVHKVDRFSRKLRITLEYFDKLGKADVGFVSIVEQMDFSTPWGKFTLSMLGGLAELYSDNLSQETKKGWHERRAQGLYCGLLPFGALKGEDGVPVPDPDTYPGLVMSFELAVQGKSNKEVAQALNAAGYRTAGNQGNRPFSKDTVRGMLQNPFYIGQLSDGNGQWLKAKHKPFISEDLWNQVQEARERNRRAPRNRPSKATISSLTGITYCWYCKGRIHVGTSHNGKRRMLCYNRSKGWDCPQKSALLEVYEYQIERYLETFHIPEDYQAKILEAHEKLQAAYDDTEKEQTRLKAQLERLKKLFTWGDLSEKQYLAERANTLEALRALTPPETKSRVLEGLAEFLKNVVKAWREANQEQRNKLARQLFDEIWAKDKQVIAVKPRPELKPFFQLSYEEFVRTCGLESLRGR